MTTRSDIEPHPSPPGARSYRCTAYSGMNPDGLEYEFGVSIRELAPRPERSEQRARIAPQYKPAAAGGPDQSPLTQEPIATWESEGGTFG